MLTCLNTLSTNTQTLALSTQNKSNNTPAKPLPNIDFCRLLSLFLVCQSLIVVVVLDEMDLKRIGVMIGDFVVWWLVSCGVDRLYGFPMSARMSK